MVFCWTFHFFHLVPFGFFSWLNYHFLFSDVPFDTHTARKLLCAEWHISFELRLKIDHQIYDLKGHKRCLLITVSDFTFENGFILVGCVGCLIVLVVFRIFCCDLSENGFKDKLPKYLLGMGDLKPKYTSDWDPFISIQFISQQIGLSYQNIFCLFREWRFVIFTSRAKPAINCS